MPRPAWRIVCLHLREAERRRSGGLRAESVRGRARRIVVVASLESELRSGTASTTEVEDAVGRVRGRSEDAALRPRTPWAIRLISEDFAMPARSQRLRVRSMDRKCAV